MKKRRPTKVIDQLDREIVLTSAARLFKIQGYERTTVKEIADACNMLPGSLHYRYKTKEAILIDLMRLGLEQVSVELIKACVGESNPAEQLRKGINAHLKVLVTGSDMVYVLLFEWRALQGDARKEMIQLRDRYEALWAGLLKPLAQKGIIHKDVDLDLLRLIGLGALNWVATWFTEEGRFTLEDIGNFVWRIIKQAVVVPGETDI